MPRAALEKSFLKILKRSGYVKQRITLSWLPPFLGEVLSRGENDPSYLNQGAGHQGQPALLVAGYSSAKFENIDELRKREGEIWGTASYPSPVTINVNIINDSVVKEPWHDYRGKLNRSVRGVRGVIDFIVREQMKIKDVKITTSAKFSLTISWSKNNNLKDDIEAAVWAWVNFWGPWGSDSQGLRSHVLLETLTFLEGS